MKTKNFGIAIPVASIIILDSLKGKFISIPISRIRSRLCFFILFLSLPFISLKGQTYFFEPCSPPSIGNLADSSYIDTLETIPQLGSIEFVQFHSTFIADTFGVINVSLPRANNADLEFNVTDVYYENSSDYFIQAKNAEGILTVYIKGSLKGATIDLVDTVYTIYPFTGNKGVLIQNDLSEGESSFCAQEESLESAEFCEEDDCGEDILDVLLLISPAANTWLTNRYNSYATWFLLVETHNILGAFRRSDIPNKRIRYAYVNYTPDFTASTANTALLRAQEDLSSFEASDLAQDLLIEYNADIAVLLSNYNWSVNGFVVFGIAFLGPNGSPFAIAQARNIDAARYTLAHEIGHIFGCEHDNGGPDCPKGMQMANGRNTIMARSGDNDRIQNFSNPNISFGGLATGVADERDNAQQIRAAFCEVADNDQHTIYGVKIINFGSVCTDELNSFYSSVQVGQCYDPWFNNYSNCGISPYSYYWEVSRFANFSSTTSIGTSSSCNFIPPSDGIYFIRVTVTSDDALVTSFSKMVVATTCPSPEWVGSEEIQNLDRLTLNGNPTSDFVLLNYPNEVDVINCKIYDLAGKVIWSDYEISRLEIKNEIDGQLKIPLQPLTSGMYILSLQTNLGTRSFQIVKE